MTLPATSIDDALDAALHRGGMTGFARPVGEALGKPPWSQQFFESCRRALDTLVSGSDGGVLQVCSCGQDDDRSSVAAAMSLSLCRTYGERVALLDLDFTAGGGQARLFGVDRVSGLGDWLENGGRLRLVPGGANRLLHLLPAGEHYRDPVWLYREVLRRRVIEAFLERFPWVVVDLPPLVAEPAAVPLVGLGNWHVLVGRYRHTLLADLQEVADLLGTTPGVTGFLLTGDRSKIPGWLRRLI